MKREVKLFGAFSMGYADVGADIYIAIGVVALFSAGATPLSFLIASIVYLTTALVYAELSSTYPLAGGAQVFAAKGLGDHFGFLAGWFLILSYAVDISLFAVASAGYLSFMFPKIKEISVSFWTFELSGLTLMAVVLISLLVFINLIGIKESTIFTEVLVALDLAVEAFILGLGIFLLVGHPTSVLTNLQTFGSSKAMEGVSYLPGIDLRLQNFLYGTTLAMSSFVGIESIAQASEEIRRPFRWIPMATKLSIISVLIFVLGLSFVSVSLVGWETLAEHREMAIAVLAHSLPVVGGYFSIIAAFTGFVICLASSNTGVIGVSRVLYSMGKFNMAPSQLSVVSKRFRTPVGAIILSGILAVFLCLLKEVEKIADVYAVAALASYILVHYSLNKIRKIERNAFRPWKVPGDVKLFGREVNLVSVIGLASTGSLLTLIILMHEIGRTIAFFWLLIGLVLYVTYRRAKGLGIISRISAEMIRPAEFLREALVLIRPYEDEDVAEDLVRGLKGRYRLHLLTIIDPRELKTSELDEERGAIAKMLELIARKLKERGFEVDYRVDFAEPSELALSLASSDLYDFTVVIIGKGSRKLEEAGLARFLMGKLPGRVIAVRR